ncbi:hypothetical protein, partial [Pseudomonas aeruginosa]|uniref:hypothetical protein n=1 Tax=Pseudomonas aeruginosa TaxID=287 RepID=UPI00405398A1
QRDHNRGDRGGPKRNRQSQGRGLRMKPNATGARRALTEVASAIGVLALVAPFYGWLIYRMLPT